MIVRRIVTFAASVAVMASLNAPEPAAAQSRVQRDVPEANRAELRALDELHHWATCLVSRTGDAAADFVTAESGSEAERHHYGRLVLNDQSSCLNVRGARITSGFLKGALAEVLYEGRRPAEPLDLAQENTGLALGGAEARLQWTSATPRDRGTAGHIIAGCYVRNYPGATHRLLRTLPGSRAERSGFRAMVPGFAACLPAGRTVTINPILMRSSLAEALYRQAMGTPAANGPSR